MVLPVTAIYASILTIMMIVLSILVSMERARAKVSIFDGNDKALGVAIRRHGNFIENVPQALILIGLCEANNLSPTYLHVMGAVLVGARILHAVGLDGLRLVTPLRLVGGLGTSFVMLAGVVVLMSRFFTG